MPVTVFTQDLRGTCISADHLVPVGLVFASASGDNHTGKLGAMKQVVVEFGKKYPNLIIVVNAKFTFYTRGHPSYDCYTVEVYGDGYVSTSNRLPNGLKEMTRCHPEAS
jgi:hypothetical protein